MVCSGHFCCASLCSIEHVCGFSSCSLARWLHTIQSSQPGQLAQPTKSLALANPHELDDTQGNAQQPQRMTHKGMHNSPKGEEPTNETPRGATSLRARLYTRLAITTQRHLQSSWCRRVLFLCLLLLSEVPKWLQQLVACYMAEHGAADAPAASTCCFCCCSCCHSGIGYQYLQEQQQQQCTTKPAYKHQTSLLCFAATTLTVALVSHTCSSSSAQQRLVIITSPACCLWCCNCCHSGSSRLHLQQRL